MQPSGKGNTIKYGTSNYTQARNTCCGGSSNFKGGRNTVRGSSNFRNGQKYTGGNDKGTDFRVQTKVNKPWKLSHSNRGF